MHATAQLGQKAARGAALLSAVALLSRASAFVGQLVLGWFLQPTDFGLFATALGFTAFAQVLAQAGLREILIQRPRRLAIWGPTATRVALLVACIGWTLMTMVSIVAPWGEGRAQLRWMLPALGLVWPLTAAGLVPEVSLTSRLAFGQTSRITITSQLCTMAMQVLLAWAGLSILALVIPYVFGAGLRTLLFWRAAGTTPSRGRAPSMRRGLRLLSRSRWAVLVSLLGMVWVSGDYLLLGMRFSPEQVGQYYFGFVLSTATITLLTGSVTQVLFPSLVKLGGDPSRQWKASYSALRILALLGLPFCAAQALVGVPLLQLVYADKWATAEWIFAALSVGMAFRLVGSPAGSLMQAQGRFRYQAAFMASLAALFLLLVAVGLWTGSLGWTVALIAVFYFLVGPSNVWVAGRPLGATWGDVGRLFSRPVGYTLLAVIAALVPERLFALSAFEILLARGFVFSAACAACALAFERDELLQVARRVLVRRAA